MKKLQHTRARWDFFETAYNLEDRVFVRCENVNALKMNGLLWRPNYRPLSSLIKRIMLSEAWRNVRLLRRCVDASHHATRSWRVHISFLRQQKKEIDCRWIKEIILKIYCGAVLQDRLQMHVATCVNLQSRKYSSFRKIFSLSKVYLAIPYKIRSSPWGRFDL